MCNIKKTTIIATDLSLRTDTNSTETQKPKTVPGKMLRAANLRILIIQL